MIVLGSIGQLCLGDNRRCVGMAVGTGVCQALAGRPMSGSELIQTQVCCSLRAGSVLDLSVVPYLWAMPVNPWAP